MDLSFYQVIDKVWYLNIHIEALVVLMDDFGEFATVHFHY